MIYIISTELHIRTETQETTRQRNNLSQTTKNGRAGKQTIGTRTNNSNTSKLISTQTSYGHTNKQLAHNCYRQPVGAQTSNWDTYKQLAHKQTNNWYTYKLAYKELAHIQTKNRHTNKQEIKIYSSMRPHYTYCTVDYLKKKKKEKKTLVPFILLLLNC